MRWAWPQPAPRLLQDADWSANSAAHLTQLFAEESLECTHAGFLVPLYLGKAGMNKYRKEKMRKINC